MERWQYSEQFGNKENMEKIHYTTERRKCRRGKRVECNGRSYLESIEDQQPVYDMSPPNFTLQDKIKTFLDSSDLQPTDYSGDCAHLGVDPAAPRLTGVPARLYLEGWRWKLPILNDFSTGARKGKYHINYLKLLVQKLINTSLNQRTSGLSPAWIRQTKRELRRGNEPPTFLLKGRLGT